MSEPTKVSVTTNRLQEGHPLFGRKTYDQPHKVPDLNDIIAAGRKPGASPDDAKMSDVFEAMLKDNLLEELPDGKIRVRGTSQQLERAGISPEALRDLVAKAYREANEDLDGLEEKRSVLIRERQAIQHHMAYLQQLGGGPVTCDNDGLYYFKDPRGGDTPLCVPGEIAQQLLNMNPDDYQLISPEELAAITREDGTADVHLVVGHRPDSDSMPSELHLWSTKTQGFVDLQ